MNWAPANLCHVRRASAALVCLLLLIAGSWSAQAYNVVLFQPLQTEISQDIAELSALENPTRAERLQLKALQRADKALAKTTLSDGKALRSLNAILGRREAYMPILSNVASNLLLGYNAQYAFTEGLLPELPDTAGAAEAEALFSKCAKQATALNEADTVAKFAARYDGAKSRLDKALDCVVRESIIPFPTELSENEVRARINGVYFQSSANSGSEVVFSAVQTESGIQVTLSGLVGSGNGPRGIQFSVPNVQIGTYRYEIPSSASFTNRTGVYTPNETNVAATEGVIFVGTTSDNAEVYGTFTASGPDFTVTEGRFRITVSSQP